MLKKPCRQRNFYEMMPGVRHVRGQNSNTTNLECFTDTQPYCRTLLAFSYIVRIPDQNNMADISLLYSQLSNEPSNEVLIHRNKILID